MPGPEDIVPLQEFGLLGLEACSEGSPVGLVPWEGAPCGEVVAKANPCLLGAAFKLVPRVGTVLLLPGSPAPCREGCVGGTALAAGHVLPLQGTCHGPWSPGSRQQVPLEMPALLTYHSLPLPVMLPVGRPAAVYGSGRPHH